MHAKCSPNAVDSGQLVPLVLLDLSSAFDTVDHDCLLTVLRNRFTVEGRAMDWFQSYLSERTQAFTAADSHSNSIAVNCSVPQGSVLGPIQFISYTEDVAELFNGHSVNFHLFADDTQLYTCAAPGREAIARQKLSTCIDDLVAWCASRRLKLNPSKTELIWFGSRTALSKMATNRSVTVGSVDVQPTDIVRNLGVLLDSELTMKQHVNKAASACFYHLRRLRQLKRHVSQDTLRQLVSAFILNRLDYCNSLLYGLPWSTIAPLQRVQNAAARLVLGLSPRDHVSSALQTLHWLPIYYRIQFKIALLMYNALAGRCPEYIKDIVTPVASNPGRQQLRSAARSDVIVPRCRTKFGSRAFSIAGPEVWNRLPQSVRSADTVRQFRRLLKTHYFQSHFYPT